MSFHWHLHPNWWPKKSSRRMVDKNRRPIYTDQISLVDWYVWMEFDQLHWQISIMTMAAAPTRKRRRREWGRISQSTPPKGRMKEAGNKSKTNRRQKRQKLPNTKYNYLRLYGNTEDDGEAGSKYIVLLYKVFQWRGDGTSERSRLQFFNSCQSESFA